MIGAVATVPYGHYYHAMHEALTEAVRELLDRIPGSDRALALAAGVPQSTVSRIRTGERSCTPEVARALADVLGRWASDCRDAEAALRQALQDEEVSDE